MITYLVTQVGVAPEAYLQYAWQGRTIEDHRAQIREALGFRESTVADAESVSVWLVEHILPREHHEERLRDMVYQRYRDLQLEAPMIRSCISRAVSVSVAASSTKAAYSVSTPCAVRQSGGPDT